MFLPMVAETTRTWDSGAGIVIKHIARAVAAMAGEDPEQTLAVMLQELSVVVRACQARAALRRRSEAVTC